MFNRQIASDNPHTYGAHNSHKDKDFQEYATNKDETMRKIAHQIGRDIAMRKASKSIGEMIEKKE